MRKPYWRSSHKCWYVNDDAGRKLRLDPDEQEAHRIWARMLQVGRYTDHDATVEAILEAWLRTQHGEATAEKFADYSRVCGSFRDFVGSDAKAAQISRKELVSWLGKRQSNGKQWSLSRQRDAGRIIQRAFRWAINRDYLPFTDLIEVKLASSQPKSQTIDGRTHARIVTHLLSNSKQKPLALVAIALRHSGGRPSQIRAVTASHVMGNRWVFHAHKTAKKTGKPLVIYMTGCLHTLTAILMHHRKSGALFRNSLDRPWTSNAIVHAFARLRERLDLPPVTAYSYRHSFATDLLLAGVDVPTVASLLGHSDIAMVSRVYGHLDQSQTHLEAALRKVSQMRASDERKP